MFCKIPQLRCCGESHCSSPDRAIVFLNLGQKFWRGNSHPHKQNLRLQGIYSLDIIIPLVATVRRFPYVHFRPSRIYVPPSWVKPICALRCSLKPLICGSERLLNTFLEVITRKSRWMLATQQVSLMWPTYAWLHTMNPMRHWHPYFPNQLG